MEISRIREQLARVEQSIEAAREMCERNTQKQVYASLTALNHDSTELKYSLGDERHDAVVRDHIDHLRTTGEFLMRTSERLQHKDTRKALVQLHDELFVLVNYLQ
ncbi:hypothetical protein D3871_22835 [Noviherbaspirillum saxi]|uniref:Uncharacterized protein n=2 Tax=Noviherbaspirillum saxi TaxID=2320863 RepID=A0A3A3FNV0_9BURK|nr:hypothetical protein D3871_22835 [Noviherbaspirillum saxi]